jgi:hydroxymethylpyrimidine pyrophosphatase-like HAD family hydrolase
VRLPADFAAELYTICDAERCIATVVGDDEVVVKMEATVDPSLAPKEMRFATALAGAGIDAPRIALIQGSGVCEVIERDLAPRWDGRVQFVTSISSYGKPILTLTATGADKGVALGVACEDLGIALSDVVAFGDSGNDLEMFRVCGAAVAMGQASDEIKSAATFVSAHNDQDGVAVAVERLLERGDLK